MKKPRLSIAQIVQMSIGFFGIQFGWSLQMGNMSPIYKYLGAADHELALLWLAAPMTGLIVQPIIGWLSDRTWTRLGRRRPFFLVGAILASIALFLMPNASSVLMAAGLLWILDASINVSMEPFRAFVADNLPDEQRGTGFTMQSIFIGLGSVVAFLLPQILSSMGVGEGKTTGIPTSVSLSFYIGAAVFLGAVLITVFTSFEYSPEKLKQFEEAEKKNPAVTSYEKGLFGLPKTMVQLAPVQLLTWLGLFFMWIYFSTTITKTVFHAVDYPAAYTTFYAAYADDGDDSTTEPTPTEVANNPKKYFEAEQLEEINKEYGSVTALRTGLITEFKSIDSFSKEMVANQKKRDEGTEWGGVMFAAYSLVTFFFGFILAFLDRFLPRKIIHLSALVIGGISLIAIRFIETKYGLILPMVGIGIAWASILSMPYAMLSGSIPDNKMGLFMGIFNLFIVVPEILQSLFFGYILENFLGGDTMMALTCGGISLILAGLLNLLVKEKARNSGQASAVPA